MRDYWNDPPEYPEPPTCPNEQCCGGYGEYLYDGKTGQVFSCEICAYQWVMPFPKDPEPLDDYKPEPDEPVERACPHGNISQCDHCDHLADLAYDADRERRYFGR